MSQNGAGVMGLIAVSHLTWKRYLQRGLDGHGVSLQQYYVLRRLARRPYMYPSEIAEDLFCDRPTASVVIANLEKRQWVTREKEVGNPRRTRVQITARGREKLDSIGGSAPRVRREGFDPLGCFNEAEVRGLKGLLQRLQAHLDQIKDV